MFGSLLLIGVSALMSGVVTTNKWQAAPDLNPEIAGIGMNKLLAGLGIAATALMGGPVALIGAGVALGSLVSEYNRVGIVKGLEVRQIAAMATPTPQPAPQPTPALALPLGSPQAVPAGGPDSGHGLWDSFRSLWQ